MLHIGIDTVELNGNGFELLINEGEIVNINTSLVKIDFEVLQEYEKDSTVIMVFPDYKNLNLEILNEKNCLHGDFLFNIEKDIKA